VDVMPAEAKNIFKSRKWKNQKVAERISFIAGTQAPGLPEGLFLNQKSQFG
jgi:hypothetical protein